MKTSTFPIEGLILVEPDVFGDHRGYFFESYSFKKYEAAGIGCTLSRTTSLFSAKRASSADCTSSTLPMPRPLVRCTQGR